MYALPEGSPQPSSTTLGSLSFSQELEDKRAQVLSRAQGTENWLGSTGGFHHLPGSTHTALTRTESFTLLGSFWHFLLTTSSRSQLHHCTFPAGGGGQARCSCPQDAVSPGTPTPAGAGRCPTAGSSTRTPSPVRKEVLLHQQPCTTAPHTSLFPLQPLRPPGEQWARVFSAARPEQSCRVGAQPPGEGGVVRNLAPGTPSPRTQEEGCRECFCPLPSTQPQPQTLETQGQGSHPAELGTALLRSSPHCSPRAAGRRTL